MARDNFSFNPFLPMFHVERVRKPVERVREPVERL